MNLNIDPRMYLNQSEHFGQTGKANKDEGMRSTCAEFEAIMLQMVFKSMRGSEESEGILESSNSQQIYRDLLDGRVAQELAHRQSMGIGEQIYKQFSNAQAVNEQDGV